MTARRLLALVMLLAVSALTVAVPALAKSGKHRHAPVTEANGVTPVGPLRNAPGSSAAGGKLFVTFCGRCHTLQAARTKGTIGPNLDQDPVSYTNVVNAILQGVGGVQAEYLLRVLTFPQIYDVAKYVTTHRQ